MVARRLLDDSGTSYYFLPIGLVISGVLFAAALITWCCKYCAKRGSEANEEPMSSQVEYVIPPEAPNATRNYPQFASSTGSGSTAAARVPFVFDNYSPETTPFTRAEMELMTVDELKILKQKLNMGYV